MPDDERLLLTAVGTGEYRPATYCWAGRSCQTRFAPVAAFRLGCDESWRGARAVVLATAEAEAKHREALAAELHDAGLDARFVRIPLGRDEDELLAVLEALTASVPRGSELVADVTFALRHLSLTFVAGLVYLTGLTGVRLERVTYGAFELKDADGTVPVLDVTHAYHLLRWFHAAATARDTGDLRPLLPLVSHLGKRAHEAGRYDQRDAANRVRGSLTQLAVAHLGGLPLAMAQHSAEVAEWLEGRNGAEQDAGLLLPLDLVAGELRERVEDWVHPDGTKTIDEMTLTEEELERELLVAEHFLEHQNPVRALRVLREWLVNLVLLRSGRASDWLDYGRARDPAARLLASLEHRRQRGLLAAGPTQSLATTWATVGQLRNDTAHGGFRRALKVPAKAKVRNQLDECRRLLGVWRREDTAGGHSGTVLVTAYGLSPGVLYSALVRVVPDRAVVLTSSEAAGTVDDAVRRAGFDRSRVEVVAFDDAWAGFDEIENRLSDELCDRLASHRQVVLNVTGGTSLLGFAAQRLAEKLTRYGVQLRRVALVDRRMPEEQRRVPWELGELRFLEPDPEDDKEGGAAACVPGSPEESPHAP